jgi:hypothetical protein
MAHDKVNRELLGQHGGRLEHLGLEQVNFGDFRSIERTVTRNARRCSSKPFLQS